MPPSAVTSSLHPINRDAIAWNEKGLIAFGCHSTLVLMDVRTLEVFQTLEQHSAAINLVSWQKPPDLLQKSDRNKSNLKCASSDITGNIFVWDVLEGAVIASFRHSTTPVTDMKFYDWPDSGQDYLISLHSNTWLILWDVGHQERVWQHKFPVPVYKLSVDPFHPSQMACASTGSTIILAEEISTSRYSPTDSSVTAITLEPRTIITPTKSTESAIIQLQHHAAFAHLLFVLFPTEICLVETQHRQVLYSAIIDGGSPMVQILPCARRDSLFVVHQNGLVSFRLANFHFSDERVSASLEYERKCFAESMHRQSARLRVMGAALCPMTNCAFALLMNSGRLLIYQLEDAKQTMRPYRILTLTDLIQLDEQSQNKCTNQLRLTQYGCYSPLSTTVTVVRMRPIGCTTGTGKEDGNNSANANNNNTAGGTEIDKIAQLAAIGSSTGIIHLLDVFSGGRIVRDFQVHTFPVKCLEWAGPNAIVSAAYIASLSSSNMVRNDLFLTDIRTGWKRQIRPEQEESPIEAIRVSHYSSYLAISFRHDPLEIWDLQTQMLLRRMNKRCPLIADMCWSGKHHQEKMVNDRTRIYRENLVVLDNDNHLYHVVVKGLHVRDGKEVSTQWKSGAAVLRCMIWKDDVLAFGDSAGRVGVWDLGKSQCRQSGLSQSTRGPVQRIVFSKLTGDYTLAAQHPTSLVVWDTEKLLTLFTLQRPGQSIIDIDMCGLTPVYISSDGMFRMALSDNEKDRNSSLSKSELPLLLKTSYCEALERAAVATGNEGKCQTIRANINDDPDAEDFMQRLTELINKNPHDQRQQQLAQLSFLHQFLGNSAMANFCQIVEQQQTSRMAKLNDSSNEDDQQQPQQIEQLPSDLFLFWSKNAYRKRMELMIRLLLSTCRSERQLELAIEKCIIMKKNELAMYYLLNSEQQQQKQQNSSVVNRDEQRLNAFRACVLSASFDTEESKCLVKLTATNLIASNFVSEGIQLLSLIDQGLDACKYLISQGLWQQSLTYAKMNRNCNFVEIYTRYAEHLASDSIGRKSLALMILASLGNWERCRTLVGEAVGAEKVDAILSLVQ